MKNRCKYMKTGFNNNLLSCKHPDNKKQITYEDCRRCQYKDIEYSKKIPIYKTKIAPKTSKRAKAVDITQDVKKIVFKRDYGACIFCSNKINVMPNAHYISRADGGLGIPENIFTACTRLTENDCHYKYDSGTEKEKAEMREKARNYLSSKYENWNENNLIYKKGVCKC